MVLMEGASSAAAAVWTGNANRSPARRRHHARRVRLSLFMAASGRTHRTQAIHNATKGSKSALRHKRTSMNLSGHLVGSASTDGGVVRLMRLTGALNAAKVSTRRKTILFVRQ